MILSDCAGFWVASFHSTFWSSGSLKKNSARPRLLPGCIRQTGREKLEINAVVHSAIPACLHAVRRGGRQGSRCACSSSQATACTTRASPGQSQHQDIWERLWWYVYVCFWI